MIVTVPLHVHEREGSKDSSTSADEMIRSYRRLFDTPIAVGFVGHDVEVRTYHPEVITFDGVEYEKQKKPNRLHIVEYPEYDFRVFAHPRETYPDDTREHLIAEADKYNVQAVERWNEGQVQYSGSVPYVEIAGDDAHSTVGTGASYMRVEVPDYDADQIMSKLKEGDFEVVNRPAYRRKMFQQLEKSINMLR